MKTVTRSAQVLVDTQQLALLGASRSKVARGMLLGGLTASLVGAVGVFTTYVTLTKVFVIGGVVTTLGGFYQGFRAGMAEAIAHQAEVDFTVR